MPQLVVNIQTNGEIIKAQIDASSGGKYSDRRGDKSTYRCLKWR
jgi:hypothetical protein